MNTSTNPVKSGVLLAILQSLGLVVIEAVLAFFANSVNLQGLVNPQMGMLIAAIALAVEQSLYNKTGKSLMGTTPL